MKSFYIAHKNQIKFNHVITALEFLYPNHLEKSTKSNSDHFNAWKYLSTLSVMKLTEFSVSNFLSLVNTFESTYSIKTKADVLSADYSSVKELIEFCKKNKYGILTKNDFFYEKNGEFISLNGNSISGEVILLEQVK